LEVGEKSVRSSAFEITQLDVALGMLSGQALAGVDFDRSKREAHWSFDIDGHFFAWPEDTAEGDCWSLHGIDGSVVTCRADGSLAARTF
jgi:hypothetical protein